MKFKTHPNVGTKFENKNKKTNIQKEQKTKQHKKIKIQPTSLTTQFAKSEKYQPKEYFLQLV